jgi:hypothetical protein
MIINARERDMDAFLIDGLSIVAVGMFHFEISSVNHPFAIVSFVKTKNMSIEKLVLILLILFFLLVSGKYQFCIITNSFWTVGMLDKNRFFGKE